MALLFQTPNRILLLQITTATTAHNCGTLFPHYTLSTVCHNHNTTNKHTTNTYRPLIAPPHHYHKSITLLLLLRYTTAYNSITQLRQLSCHFLYCHVLLHCCGTNQVMPQFCIDQIDSAIRMRGEF